MQKPILLIDPQINLSTSHTEQLNQTFHLSPLEFKVSNKLHLERAIGLLLHSRLPKSSFENFKNLRWIAIRAKNTDYVDLEFTKQKNIQVVGIPSLGDTAVSEHTFCLILALTKHLVVDHLALSSGHWRAAKIPGMNLNGKTLGIVGFGKIGQKVAKLAEAFGMSVLVAKSASNLSPEFVDLKFLLEKADIVTLHLSSCSENKNLFDFDALSKMKRGALLINTARGMLVDENALYALLKAKHLGGAGLDVFKEEPPLNSALLQLPNVICTPHTAFLTEETLEEMNEALVQIALSKLDGDKAATSFQNKNLFELG